MGEIVHISLLESIFVSSFLMETENTGGLSYWGIEVMEPCVLRLEGKQLFNARPNTTPLSSSQQVLQRFNEASTRVSG
jgi:hypothetical protein